MESAIHQPISHYSIEETKAFVATCDIAPYQEGALSGLVFSIKDSMNLRGYRSTCGNPKWLATHSIASSHAICVEQLLCAGARCIGKTVTDELSFGLDGENHFYGTPLNPRAPDRVPGGSSSGTASAVACGVSDFDLGTDAGGSIRIPASNCGLFGLRPSTGAILNAGVQPFAPSFDTIGICTQDAGTLTRVSQVLLRQSPCMKMEKRPIYLLDEAWNLCDEDIKVACLETLKSNEKLSPLEHVSLKSILNISQEYLRDTFNLIQYTETWAIYGDWIESVNPEFGPRVAQNFERARNASRSRLGDALLARQEMMEKMDDFLKNDAILCFPTTPTLAPFKGSLGNNQNAGNYYPRALSLTAISGLCRLPEVTVPLTMLRGVPIGTSFLSRHGTDMNLVSFVNEYFS